MALPVSDNQFSLPPIKFYGHPISVKNKVKHEPSEVTGNMQESSRVHKKPLLFKLNRLCGPSQTWKVFKKQNDALACAKMRKNGLMAFAFQQSTGERLFLVAHPQIFWHYDSVRIPSHRCTYEIIPEYSVCKLYFDLEYDIVHNPNSVGNAMVDTFISVICYYIKKEWGIECNRKHVLDLDSTTDTKFSRHLIFQLPFAAFRNNYHVGSFVKHICNEIRSLCTANKAISNMSTNRLANFTKLEEIGGISTLIVKDSEGRMKLLCDEAVYSKNRHFRLYQSTKCGKNANLLLSTQNMFCPDSNLNGDETIFLNSLITYVVTDSSANVRILEFNCKSTSNRPTHTRSKTIYNEIVSSEIHQQSSSPYIFIDNFVKKLVSPGHIWRSAFFTTSDVIVYDIIGNRYCGNIGREHRSNNIKYIIDIKQCCYYQKCYDPDCYNYRSPAVKLPVEICFMLEDDSEFVDDYPLLNTQGDFGISDEDFFEVLNVIEDVSFIDFENDVDLPEL